MLFIPSHLRGGGLGTLVEPAKYEPRETACRMAEGVRSEKAQNVHPLREDRNLWFRGGGFYIPSHLRGGGVGRGGNFINCHSELRILVIVKR